ncbi:SMP-30/Gluconolaconase/LRE-like region-domain-containing protein [Tricharina praecox]|uniref:SMP-30/Gluconolaconase/LRE-like region-domain-containing protein n=1 Tax=Tricharina praecox TaxID=43433 RepID=UPI00221EC7B6|nr:SMP-30/Gluconolaconase/LRE-like region-domain-containing protein [Tricharina praecox]KAI5855696.1 SMP-30/Gluconolaconase/LRE-like region-domain-containing protein [Tricharina praecox]
MSSSLVIPTIATAATPLLHSPDFWLPESPLHDPTTGLTHFTDIPSKRIYTFSHFDSASLSSISVSDYVGALFLSTDPSYFLAAASRGIARVHKDTGALTYLNTYYADDEEKAGRMRANDAGVDSHGRIWVGVMTSFGLGPPKEEGAVFVSDTDGTLRKVKEPVAVPNGIVFAPDNKTAYITDTRNGVIYKYPFNAEKGELGEEEVFVKFAAETHGPGSPDGVAVSADGDLWVAMFNGSCVLRLDGKTAQVKGKIVVEGSKQVACPRFVGRSLVIATGALVHMDPTIREECPYAGDVFVVEDVGIEGAEIYVPRLAEGL